MKIGTIIVPKKYLRPVDNSGDLDKPIIPAKNKPTRKVLSRSSRDISFLLKMFKHKNQNTKVKKMEVNIQLPSIKKTGSNNNDVT